MEEKVLVKSSFCYGNTISQPQTFVAFNNKYLFLVSAGQWG